MCLIEYQLHQIRRNPFVLSSSSIGLDTKKFPGSSDSVLKTAILTAKLNLNGLFYFSIKKAGSHVSKKLHLLPVSTTLRRTGGEQEKQLSLVKRQDVKRPRKRRIHEHEKQGNQRSEPMLSLILNPFITRGDKEKCLPGTS